MAAGFLDMWRRLLHHSEFSVVCAVAGATVNAEYRDLVERSGQIFRDWSTLLAELLLAGGVPEDRTPALATLVIAGSEGAVIMARAQRSMDPFEFSATELLAAVSDASP